MAQQEQRRRRRSTAASSSDKSQRPAADRQRPAKRRRPAEPAPKAQVERDVERPARPPRRRPAEAEVDRETSRPSRPPRRRPAEAETESARPARPPRRRPAEVEVKHEAARPARPARRRPAAEPEAERPRAQKRRRPAEPATAAEAESAPQRPARPPRRRPAPDERARPKKSATSQRPPRKRRRRRLSPEERARQKSISKFRTGGVIASAAILGVAAIVGLLFFARPTKSEVERRELTAMPEFTLESFLNGSYFSDLSLWYSDTYPLREQLVSADQAMSSLYGIKTETQMVGGTKQADELPVASDASSKDSSSSDKTDEDDTTSREPVEVPTAEVMAEAIQDQVLDGLYVKGDAAYNIYYFAQEAVEEYANTMNAAADAVAGQAEVYSLVVPNASGILLSDQEVKDLGGTNQVDAINYFYSLYNDDVHAVDTVSALKEHTDDYIYFRTDHHWTALGAYYGYQAFCKEKGIEPEDYNNMEHKNFGEFLGSLYAQLNSPEMAANPDTIDAWIPNGTNEMTIWEEDGTEGTYNVITDTSDWDPAGKTMAFIMGDQNLEKIENPTINDGSSCLVVKDSFGDFFVPWLVDKYQTVWVADVRYFTGNITDFVNENDVKDLIFVNNISLAGGGTMAPAILGRL